MDYSLHIIHNFPENYPLWKKFFANTVYFFGRIIIHPRKNLLSGKDLISAANLLKPGDIVIVGGLKRLSHLIIRGPFTHALLYYGNRKFIHAIADGVEFDSLHRILCEYDTLAILRPKIESKKQIKTMLSYAKIQLGKPFDYEFTDDSEKFYCSELVLDSLKSAKIKTNLKNTKKVFHPKNFLRGNFKLVFTSHNLSIDDLKK